MTPDAPPSINPDQTSFNPSTINPGITNQSAPDSWAVAAYLRQRTSGARWFFIIAVLSIINAIIVHANGRISFLAGLAITQLISGLAIGLSEGLGSGVVVVAIGLELMVAAIFSGFGILAQKGQQWAFIVGMGVYLLDGLLLLLFGDWFALAFHAYVLYCLYKGFNAGRDLNRLQTEARIS